MENTVKWPDKTKVRYIKTLQVEGSNSIRPIGDIGTITGNHQSVPCVTWSDGSFNCYGDDEIEIMTTLSVLPTNPADRKAIPIASGVIDYFPAALAEIAKVSKAGNDQHHPGQPLHWERGKSTDHADTIIRHFLERGSLDTDGQRHSAKLAWRALALLQEELEAEGAPKARGSR